MPRTTPPRAVDVVKVFPELEPLARAATRLHPRRGATRPEQSSIGGPLLWPADEPWPMCPRTEHRSFLREGVVEGPSPLVPVLQLYVRDVPGLPHPPGTDLLQILWCPIEESEAFEQPLLLWRDSEAVRGRREASPAPHPDAWDELIPQPCTVDPEPVIDYPYEDAPQSLLQRFEDYDDVFFEDEERGWSMWSQLAMPGCKVGGYPLWCQGPRWPSCPRCRGEMGHLLTLLGDEGGRRWIPFEEWETAGYGGGLAEAAAAGTEAARANRHPLGMHFGDNGVFSVFYCEECPTMPLRSGWDSC